LTWPAVYYRLWLFAEHMQPQVQPRWEIQKPQAVVGVPFEDDVRNVNRLV
jgi:hypothetical protein